MSGWRPAFQRHSDAYDPEPQDKPSAWEVSDNVKSTYIMVLNDGETFTDLKGCFIAEVPDNLGPEDIEDLLDSISELEIVQVFDDKPVDLDAIFVDILHSVRLAMDEAGLAADAEEVVGTVNSYITNHYGES